MKIYFLIIFCISCGEREPITLCYGEIGSFIGTPLLSINNCISPPSFPPMEIVIEENSEYRECGWHNLYKEDKKDYCNTSISKSIYTQEKGYNGFIILDVDCLGSKCRAVWEVEFKGRKNVL